MQPNQDEYHSYDSKSDSKSDSVKLSNKSVDRKRGLDGKFNTILDDVVRRNSQDLHQKPQNIF